MMVMSAHIGIKEQGIVIDEPTLRCHHNPLVGTLGIQEPVILGEPQVLG